MRRRRLAWFIAVGAGGALAVPGGASAAVTIGASDLAPQPTATCGGCGLYQVQARDGSAVASPFRGVVMRVRIKSLTADAGAVHVLATGPRRDSGGLSFRDATLKVNHPVTLSAGLNDLPVHLPIDAGERIGLRLDQNGTMLLPGGNPPVMGRASSPPTALGQTVAYQDLDGFELLLQAVIEPDLDGDHLGDETEDTDDDGDGRVDTADNCIGVSNPDQDDTDGDGQGDACDLDDDADGTPDATDTCVTVPNPGQDDLDGDGLGDACDADQDGDTVPDFVDTCDRVPNPQQEDSDLDGIGNACEDDDDADGRPDESDNCPTVSNEGQEDLDGDGQGDACDADQDGDGVPDQADNCDREPNPDQGDAEGDALGDACDPDDDNDGLADTTDLCDTTPSPDNRDSDGDGTGDACDPVDGRSCPAVAPSGVLSRPLWGLPEPLRSLSCTVGGLGL